MSIDTWKGGNGAWTTAANWSSGVPTSTSSVSIGAGVAHVSAGITIASLSNAATLDFVHAGTSKITGNVTNAGFFNIDDQKGAGGTSLTVGGTLTNTGYLQFGFSDNSLAAKDTITVGALVNSIGEIDLNGGATAARALLLDVTGAASFGVAGQVTGNVSLSGFSTIEFKSGGFTKIASGATLSLDGANALIANAASPNFNSALTGLSLVAGTLSLSNGAKVSTKGGLTNINQLTLSSNAGSPATTLAIGGGLLNAETTSVDAGGSGGSIMTVNGVVTNDEQFFIGSAALRQQSTVKVKGFTNNGFLSISSGLPTAALALLEVSAVAGFGQAGLLQGTVELSGNSEIQFASGQITSIDTFGELDLIGRTARIADASATGSNSALTGLKNVSGTLNLASGSQLTTGSLKIAQFAQVNVDTFDEFNGTGGSLLTINGALTNGGAFNLGDEDLTGATNAVVNSFINTLGGSVHVTGSFEAAERAQLTVKTGAAGFGIAGHLIGDVEVEGDASIQFASGEITRIDTGSTLVLFGPQATIADLATPNSNSALTGLANIFGELDIDDGVKIAAAGSLANSGTLQVDGNSDGGSVLTVKQTLTNSGQMTIGNEGLDRNSQVSAAAIKNTGTLILSGGVGASQSAILDIAGAAGFGAAGHVTGDITVAGRSRIQFGGAGVITTIDANAGLFLNGATAVIANASSSTTNSALKGLKQNNGVLFLSNGAALTTTGGLTNTDSIEMDSTFLPKVSGGSTLTIGGVLKNTGTLSIGTKDNTASDKVTATGLVNSNSITLFGNSGAAQALVTITGAAGFGTAGVLTGHVTETGFASIHFASGQISQIASGATLDLEGAHAFVSEGAVAGNSALAGLKEIVGNLELNSGAKIKTTVGLSNDGIVTVDSGVFGGGGTGGSQLNVGGALANHGVLDIGNSATTQAVLAFSTLLTNDNGVLHIAGGSHAAAKAELDVAGAAGSGTAGVLSGTISLAGFSALRFASGLITTLKSGASLLLDGANAVIAIGKATTNNALQGLTSVAGVLSMDDGASFTTSGNLGLTGGLEIDAGFNDAGGSKITVGGALTNSSFSFTIGNEEMTKTAQVTAASFVNNGELTLDGGAVATGQALLNITGAAGFGTAGQLQQDVVLSGFSAVKFASGAITSIASGANLSLDGAHAFIETGATNSNSALAGLASNAGFFSLLNGAVVAVTGDLTNNDQINVDNSGDGGSRFTVGGQLTNNFGINVGVGGQLKAASVINNDFIDLNGNNARFTVTGAVGGSSGFFNLLNGTLEFDGAVGAGETVAFEGSAQLKLADATAFAAAISGFAAGDTIDLTTFKTGTTHSFAGGVLTLKNGANTAHLNFGGGAATDFTITSSAAGTIIGHH